MLTGTTRTNDPRPNFRSLDEIKRANEDSGFYWFSPDTLRFFRSRISDTIHPARDGSGAFFVSSEQQRLFDGALARRTYSVRFAWAGNGGQKRGDVDNIKGEYSSSAQAHRAAKAFAERGSPVRREGSDFGWYGREAE